MCSIWLELGNNRIPMTRKELESLAGCIKSAPTPENFLKLDGILTDMLEFLSGPDEPIPTNDTLVQLAAIASEVQRCPVPEGPYDGIGDAMMDIGTELVATTADWFDDTGFNHYIVIKSYTQLVHWAGMLRGNDDDQYADDVDSLVNRLDLIIPELR